MHPTARHSAADCREIQKLAKRVSGRREQSSKDGSPPPRQRPGKEKASDSGAAAWEKELGYQSPARELRACTTTTTPTPTTTTAARSCT